jgi:hypothetical protein
VPDPDDEAIVYPRISAYELEVLDREGRGRWVFGALPAPGADPGPFGAELRDAEGRARITLALTDAGPAVLIDHQGGTNVLALGVNDPGDGATRPGSYLYLGDFEGAPVFGWRVRPDGRCEGVGSDQADETRPIG